MDPGLAAQVSERIDFFARWLDSLRLADVLSSEQLTWLHLFGLLLISAVSGGVIYAFSRFYYRGITAIHQTDNSLIPASVLATLVFYQAAPWPGLSILMVAILAFVHYRTVIKDLTDVTFIFWAILSGLFIGLGFFWQIPAANFILAAIATVAILVRDRRHIYLILIRCRPEVADRLFASLQPLEAKLKSRSEKEGQIDLTVAVPLRNISIAVIDTIAAMDGVHSAVMINSQFAANRRPPDENSD